MAPCLPADPSVIVIVVTADKSTLDDLHFLPGLAKFLRVGSFLLAIKDFAGFVVIDDLDLHTAFDRFALGLGRASLDLDKGIAVGQISVGNGGKGIEQRFRSGGIDLWFAIINLSLWPRRPPKTPIPY